MGLLPGEDKGGVGEVVMVPPDGSPFLQALSSP